MMGFFVSSFLRERLLCAVKLRRILRAETSFPTGRYSRTGYSGSASLHRIRAIIIGLALTAVTGCAGSISDSPAPSPLTQALHSGLSPTVYLPLEAEEWSLPNGLHILFRQDEELPIVAGTLNIRGGSLWGADDERGVIGAMGLLMRQGGAGSRSAEDLDRELERLSASVGSGFGGEMGSVSFRCLAQDTEQVFGLFRDVVREPRFDEERLALWAGQSLDGIRRRRDDASTIADISLSQLIYGDRYYGRILTSRDVRAISRLDLVRRHRALVRPDNAYLVLTGAISRADAERLVAAAFGDWRPRGGSLRELVDDPTLVTPEIVFVHGPFSQATIMLGQKGVNRHTADNPAIEVFNSLFGTGGFGSRLMLKIRSEMGLAYSAYGAIGVGLLRPRNLVVMQTKSESVAEALSASIKVLREMQQMPASAEDLEETKRTLKNSFLFRFDSVEESVQRQALIRMLGYPLDYDRTYLDRIDAVTADAVQQVARERWDLKHLAIVVVGDEKAFERMKQYISSSPAELPGYSLATAEFDERLMFSRSNR